MGAGGGLEILDFGLGIIRLGLGQGVENGGNLCPLRCYTQISITTGITVLW